MIRVRVRIAGVADAVAVGVLLVGVRDEQTVIAGIILAVVVCVRVRPRHILVATGLPVESDAPLGGVAGVLHRAENAVATRRFLTEQGLVLTSPCRVAGVGRAEVVVVAVLERSGACSVAADIAYRAGLAVVAPDRVVGVRTAVRGVARVVGAGVAVVAVLDRSTRAVAGCALVFDRALVAVVADRSVHRRRERRASETRDANIQGARVAVRALCVLRSVAAARVRVAGVHCAVGLVVAVYGRGRGLAVAGRGLAVVHRARVVVATVRVGLTAARC